MRPLGWMSLCAALCVAPLALRGILAEETAPGALADTAATASHTADVVIVLVDGSEITGSIVEEDDTAVVVNTIYGRQKIPRERIREIRRDANPAREEFDERFARASRRAVVTDLNALGKWALERGLEVEARRAFERVIEIDDDNEEARIALGHARLDGEWLDEVRVAQLIQQGYVLRGADLVRPDGNTGSGTGGSAGEKPVAGRIAGSAISRVAPLTEELLAAKERDRKRNASKRARRAERFAARKLEEYRGVAWPERHVLKKRHFEIHCDSTREVAQSYGWIMEKLHQVLSTRFTGRTTHRLKSSVFIYKTQDEFMAETGVGRGTGAFFQPSSKQIRAYHGVFGTTGTTLPVLCHEGTHLFQSKKLNNMDNIPAWLIEGMAVYFGDYAKLDPKKKTIRTGLVPRDRLLPLQERIRSGKHMRLKPLVKLRYQQLNGALYADAWSLCYFLFDGPELKKGRKFISNYWRIAEQRKLNYSDFEMLAKRLFGSMDEMEEMWTDYTLGLKPEPAGVPKGDRLESYDFKFRARLPSEGWKWEIDAPERGALVAMRVPDSPVQIRIRLLNKADHEQDELTWVEKLCERQQKKYGVVEREKIDLYGVPTYRLRYGQGPAPSESESSDGEAKAGEGPKVPEDDPKKKAPTEKPAPELRFETYVQVLVNRAYLLVCEAPADEFEAFQPYFAEAARDFEPIYENRW